MLAKRKEQDMGQITVERNVGAIVAWVVGGIATLMTIGLLIGNLSS